VHFNYIIVGQGIAGSVLALELSGRGKKVLIIDEENESSSSKIAAGIYNPIVFKRLVKSWDVENFIPALDRFYNNFEKNFKLTIHYKTNIVKVFTGEEEKAFWIKKSKEKDLEAYLSKEIIQDLGINFFNDNPECSLVTKSGMVEVGKFLEAVKQHFVLKDQYIKARLNYEDILFETSRISWKDITADKIIFCEGHKATQNPHFSWLPFVLTKGELLKVKITGLDCTKIINKGIFILPLGNELFIVGATYSWDKLTEIPTPGGKDEILQKLRKIISLPIEVLEHRAGIRPTIKDRRPILGKHPKFDNVLIFNGLGTKGVMMAPLLARKLVSHMEDGTILGRDIDINRFISYFLL
jgi:glycine oxidase